MLLTQLLEELKISRISKALKTNHYARAEKLGRELISTRPTNARVWLMLGEAVRAQKRVVEAINYDYALALQPGHTQALKIRGLLHLESGNNTLGLQDLMTAHNADPADTAIAINLSTALINQNNSNLAEQVLQTTLGRAPETPDLLCNLALARLNQNQHDEACRLFRQALEINPKHRISLLNLGHALVDLHRLADARAAFQTGVEHYPDDPDLLTGLATVEYADGQYEVALAQLQHITATHLRHSLAHIYLGITLRDLRRLDEAERCFRHLIDVYPNDGTAHLNLAFVLLALGRYEEGWAEYEARRATSETPGEVFQLPAWDGRPTQAAVLIYAEQGLGDEIMFASCAADALRAAPHIVWQCDPRLGALFTRSFPQLRIAAIERDQRHSTLQEYCPLQAQLPVGSLPGLFRRERKLFPSHAGYLRANPMRVEYWRKQLATAPNRYKVGLCWSGGVTQARAAVRSIDLQRWQPILTVPGIDFVCLQRGAVMNELTQLRQSTGITVLHFPNITDDIDDLAALMNALDCVISVQSTTVHLEGALGRPCLAMVPFSAEWRYHADGLEMLWYPSVTVHRQPASRVWEPVIETVAVEMRRMSTTPP